MPEEKKIIDKILPKEWYDLSVDNCGLWIDQNKNEIIATDSFIMLTLSIPQLQDNPEVNQFIEWSDECIRIAPEYAKIHDIWALRVQYWVETSWWYEWLKAVPTWLDIMSPGGKITIYSFQIWANPPQLKELPSQTNLFWEELEMTPLYATKAKITFDQCLMALGWMTYQIGESLIYATWTTKNGYQFHLMVRTPKESKSL
jgi:hypothetical protein